MATVASVMAGWDSTSGRPIRGCVCLKITATKAAVVAQTGNGDGFDQLVTAPNDLIFAVPGLLDSDDVLGAQLAQSDANLRIVYAARAGSSPSPTVAVQFMNIGADDAQPANDPVLIDIYVARR